MRHAFAWDAGFHLLAARLIREGKRPYLDFCFPQTPLNAYLNAGWMSIFGDTWRSVQALAAIMTAAAILLTADYVYTRFPVREWKLPAAIFSALLCVSIYNVLAFGTVAQAYGVCLFLSVAALRLAMAAVRRATLWLIFAAGLCAGASAACSLLTAAALPVLLAWCVFENKSRLRTVRKKGTDYSVPACEPLPPPSAGEVDRAVCPLFSHPLKTAAAFVAGSIVPFLPVAWLALEGPRQVLFNLIQYQTLYRRAKWDGASEHDFEVFFSVSGTPAAVAPGSAGGRRCVVPGAKPEGERRMGSRATFRDLRFGRRGDRHLRRGRHRTSDI